MSLFEALWGGWIALYTLLQANLTVQDEFI